MSPFFGSRLFLSTINRPPTGFGRFAEFAGSFGPSGALAFSSTGHLVILLKWKDKVTGRKIRISSTKCIINIKIRHSREGGNPGERFSNPFALHQNGFCATSWEIFSPDPRLRGDDDVISVTGETGKNGTLGSTAAFSRKVMPIPNLDLLMWLFLSKTR